jgi:hypothetical protein
MYVKEPNVEMQMQIKDAIKFYEKDECEFNSYRLGNKIFFDSGILGRLWEM